MRKFPLMMSGVVVAAALFSNTVWSQESAAAYPSKPVTFVNPSAAGGPSDIEARMYGEKLTASLHQPIVMEYRLGAAQTIGAAYVAKAKPDGYTLLVTTGTFSAFPALIKDLPFDTIRDFAHVSLMSQSPFVLVTYPSFPAKNLVEYLAYVKANPGKVSFGTFGTGSITHLSGAWIHTATDTKVTYVGYKDTITQMTDVMGNRLDAFLIGLVVALPQLKAGKIRALATTTTFRSKVVPDVATVAEQGVPGYNASLWVGFVAPAATPAPIVNKLSAELSKVARERDVIARIEESGGMTVGSTPVQFRQFVVTETDRWRKLVQDNGIKLD